MKSTHTFSIGFLIRKCKEDKKNAFIIYVRIAVIEARREISTKEQILTADWDSNKEVVKRKQFRLRKLISASMSDLSDYSVPL